MATIKYWNGTAWELAIVGKQGPAGPTGPTGPAGQATLQRYRFTAAGGETSESGADDNGNTLAYTVGLEEVFLNGVLLVRNQDYTASNGTSITGLEALTAGDVLEVLAWGVFNVSNTISTTLIDAKADLLVGTAADTVGRLAVGANGTVLTANSATATGLAWTAPAAGAYTLLSTTTLSGSSTTISSIDGTYKDLFIWLQAFQPAANASLDMRINNDTGSNYFALSPNGGQSTSSTSTTYRFALDCASDRQTWNNEYILLPNYSQTTTRKAIQSWGFHANQNAGFAGSNMYLGMWANTSAITSITFLPAGTTWTGGTVYVYGVK